MYFKQLFFLNFIKSYVTIIKKDVSMVENKKEWNPCPKHIITNNILSMSKQQKGLLDLKKVHESLESDGYDIMLGDVYM